MCGRTTLINQLSGKHIPEEVIQATIMEDEDQVADATTTDEELELELNLDDTEDVETLKAQIAKDAEAKRQLTARAKAAEEKLKAATPKPLPKPKLDEDVLTDVKELKLAERKRQFGYRHNLSPEETDKLFRFTPADGDPEETLKDPFFETALSESRKAARAADATPSSSNRSVKVEGKTFAQMTPEERKANWDKFVVKK